MKKLTTTSYAILGLLALRPWSAYELSQQMRRSLGLIWPRAERGIYDEPKKLVDHGLATAADESRGRRERTVYSITPAGRRALRSWLQGPSVGPQFESEALLRMAFADHGTKDDALRTLATLRTQADEWNRMVVHVGREYVEGRGPFPNRVHLIALFGKFYADYLDLLDRWAAWAADEIETWPDVAGPENYPEALEVLAELVALRPVKSG